MFFCSHLFADYSETIATGRPGQSIGAGVVGKNVFQVQTGYEANKLEMEGSKTKNSIINNVFRLGISDKYEVSSVLDFNNLNNPNSNIGNFQLGGRVNLIKDAKGWLPQLCFQSRLQFFDGNGDKVTKLKLNSIISGVFDLKNLGSLTSNLVFSNIGRETTKLSTVTISWGKNLTQNLSYFLEYYNNYNSGSYENFIDTGFGYLINKDTQLDLSIGSDFEKGLTSNFVSFGFSWRKV